VCLPCRLLVGISRRCHRYRTWVTCRCHRYRTWVTCRCHRYRIGATRHPHTGIMGIMGITGITGSIRDQGTLTKRWGVVCNVVDSYLNRLGCSRVPSRGAWEAAREPILSTEAWISAWAGITTP
jgi:hypothetical protein